MQQSYDVVIIGGGVVGSAIARELSRYKLRIAVLEKESDVCTQTSGRNTGMLHAGFLYKTGSLKAICAVEGNQEFDQVARELDVPFKRTGKLIVGFTDEHRQRLEQFMARGDALPGEELLGAEHAGNGHVGQQTGDDAPLFDFHTKPTFLLSGNRRGIEDAQVVVEAVLVGVGLLHAAGHVQNQVEQLGAHVGDGLLAGGDGAGVDVDEVKPVLLHLVAGADLDDRGGGQPVGGAPAGHKDLKPDAAGQLAGPADDVAGGSA